MTYSICRLASHADVRRARHVIFPFVGKETLRDDPKERLRRRPFASSVTSLKVEVNVNMDGILRGLKKG